MPVYVGITMHELVVERIIEHTIARNEKSTRFYRAWADVELHDFEWEILRTGTLKECGNLERKFISVYRQEAELRGYEGILNVNDGGEHPLLTPKKKKVVIPDNRKKMVPLIMKEPEPWNDKTKCPWCDQQVASHKLKKHQWKKCKYRLIKRRPS